MRIQTEYIEAKGKRSGIAGTLFQLLVDNPRKRRFAAFYADVSFLRAERTGVCQPFLSPGYPTLQDWQGAGVDNFSRARSLGVLRGACRTKTCTSLGPPILFTPIHRCIRLYMRRYALAPRTSYNTLSLVIGSSWIRRNSQFRKETRRLPVVVFNSNGIRVSVPSIMPLESITLLPALLSLRWTHA